MSKNLPARIMRIGLEEVLGERRPPDLSARILASLDATESRSAEQIEAGNRALSEAFAAASLDTSAPAQPLAPAPQPHVALAKREPSLSDSGRFEAVRRESARQDFQVMIWSSLALVFAICLSVASIIAIMLANQPPQVASPTNNAGGDSTQTNSQPVAPSIAAGPRIATPRGSEFDDDRNSPELVANNSPTEAQSESGNESPQGNSGTQVADASSPTSHRLVPDWQGPWEGLVVPAEAGVVQGINEGIRARWVAANVSATPGIDDVAWAERAFMAIIGRRPDAYELVDFEVGNVDRAVWAQQLTQAPKYRKQFAATWAARISRYLLNRESPSHRLVAPEAFQTYLAQRLIAVDGIDDLVEELLTAEGGLSPNQDDFNPAVSYLVALDDGKGIAATQSILEKFWGQQARCATCHDYQGSPSLTQEEFWSTNAHLRQMVVEGNQEAGLRLSSADYLGELGDPEHVAVFYETPARQLIATFPRFTTGAEHPESGRLAQFDRRRALGRRIVTDSRFPETWVDWTWGEVLGYPLGGTPTGYDLRADLAMAFAADGFRLDRLVSWIVLSDAFGRSSAPNGQFAADSSFAQDSPWRGTQALFSHHYPPQQVFSSPNRALAQLEAAHEQGVSAVLAFRSGRSLENGSPAPSQGLAFVDQQVVDWQLLEGWNTDEARAAQLDRIVTSPLPVRKKIEHLFLMALGTSASQEQLVRCEKLIENSSKPISVYQDIWFALSRSADRR